MARDESDNFLVRPTRSRGHRIPGNPRAQPFFRQVENAVRQAGGNPGRIGRRSGGKTGRYNARGRGANFAAALARQGGNAGWEKDSAGRFRARRVVVKARIVRLNPQRHNGPGPPMRTTSSRAVDAHLRYIERDGVTRDGERGKAYCARGNEADGKGFVARSRGDRHQFRFIVAPEDAAEMADLRGFTRDLMRRVELDLNTGLDWIAIDHHNTGHPHTHIMVRGVLDDDRILYIAGDYIAHGIRHRASELVTRELGHQSEFELQRRAANEVTAERLTRLDAMALNEQRAQGMIDLRPEAAARLPVRESRNLMIGRVRQLQRYGLASECEPGRWRLCDRAAAVLNALEARNEAVESIHRALAINGIADARGVDQYAVHGERPCQTIVGRVLANGRCGDMNARAYLVVDGIDGRVHHLELRHAGEIEQVGRGMIVQAGPVVSGPRPVDRGIAAAARPDGRYRPARHLERIGEGGQAYGLSRGGEVGVRTLSALSLEQQIDSDGATWLDRALAARDGLEVWDSGFGREVRIAMSRRAQGLVGLGLARARDTTIDVPRTLVAELQNREVDRVGRELAHGRGLAYAPSGAGEHVSGRLAGTSSLASGCFALIEDGLGLQLVPWQPLLERKIGQHVAGVRLEDGGIAWMLERNRELSL